ncbi:MULTISPECIES: ParB N-terminal domain-containing protein [Streptomyces]|uniref:ParB N-terminal domain-containing protein n=1 Tax=Streptomyces TaxID=1883 RepID=UPI00117CDFB3|nr:ParB N-terminal domain-containing protein [Streptomyces kasugaensis]
MLSKDELYDLAESIRSDGQHEPIVLDADGVLLDGRNRLAACEIAGVEPRFTTYTGDDPKGVVLSHNLLRRHISKGQQAMIIVLARSFSEHSLRHHAKLHHISLTRLSNAATVLNHSPHLAEQVRTGALTLDAAYRTVRENKARAAEIQAQHNRLREHAPDLAEQVSEGLLTLADATTTLDQRQHEEEFQRVVKHTDALRLADGDPAPSLVQLVEQGDITWGQAHQRAEQFHADRRDAIQQAQQALRVIAEHWATVQDLATRRDTPYVRDILDGLPADARSLAQSLTTLV